MPVVFGSEEARVIARETRHAPEIVRLVADRERKLAKAGQIYESLLKHRGSKIDRTDRGASRRWAERDASLSGQYTEARGQAADIERRLASIAGSLDRAQEIAAAVKAREPRVEPLPLFG